MPIAGTYCNGFLFYHIRKYANIQMRKCSHFHIYRHFNICICENLSMGIC